MLFNHYVDLMFPFLKIIIITIDCLLSCLTIDVTALYFFFFFSKLLWEWLGLVFTHPLSYQDIR